jgi:lia operon protein LiaF
VKQEKEFEMQNRSQALMGAGLLVLGSGFLLANVLQINFWAVCFPAGLIVLGVLLLVRPRVFDTSSASSWRLFGDVRRGGEWTPADEEFWLLIGSTRLDFTQAQLPAGETHIRINGLIGDVDVLVPPDVGVTVSASGLIVDLRTPTDKVDRFLSPANSASLNYASAERKLHLSTTFLIGDIDVLQR